MFDARSVSYGRRPRGSRSGRGSSCGRRGPSNGPLLVGVAASILIMVGLGMLIVKFMGEPGRKSVQKNQSGHSLVNGPLPWSADPACAGAEEKSCAPPTPMTFYKQLTAQDRHVAVRQETGHRSGGPGTTPVEPPGNTTGEGASNGPSLHAGTDRMEGPPGLPRTGAEPKDERPASHPPGKPGGDVSPNRAGGAAPMARTRQTVPDYTGRLGAAANNRTGLDRSARSPMAGRLGSTPGKKDAPAGTGAAEVNSARQENRKFNLGNAAKADSLISKKKAPRTRYMVQVGAYSDPTTAVKWAQHWRWKGFSAVMKPVATQEGRVMYRIHVGGFDSAEQADHLVSQLKKEGVAALRRKVGN